MQKSSKELGKEVRKKSSKEQGRCVRKTSSSKPGKKYARKVETN